MNRRFAFKTRRSTLSQLLPSLSFSSIIVLGLAVLPLLLILLVQVVHLSVFEIFPKAHAFLPHVPTVPSKANRIVKGRHRTGNQRDIGYHPLHVPGKVVLRLSNIRNIPPQDDDDDDCDDDAQLFFDDFDFTAGDPASDLHSSLFRNDNLQSLSPSNDTPTRFETLLDLPEFQKVIQEESKRKSLIERNWQRGNWKCRGFSLDKMMRPDRIIQDNGDEDEEGVNHNDDDVIKISQIALDETVVTTSTRAALGFGVSTEMIAVGRTDGTVYVVTLGEEYLTKFRARLLLKSDHSDNGGQDEYIVPRVEMEMVNENDKEEEMEETILSNDFSTENSSLKPSLSPFEIECQFQAHGRDEPISALLFHDDTVYTASKTSGQVKSWKIDHVDGKAVVMPSHNLDGAHKDEVVALKTLSDKKNIQDVNDHNLLLSASRDGSFAIWDMDGDMVYRCEMMNEDGDVPVSIHCADVDTSCGSEHIIYLGLSDGYVVGYSVSELLSNASEGNTCTVPKCRFLAHDPLQQRQRLQHDQKEKRQSGYMGVTAISCGGPEHSSKMTLSSILVTGGADGSIKQWEMLQYRKSSNSFNASASDENGNVWKLEHWPRLTTQRMKGRAHVFQGHDGPITTIKCDKEDNTSKILSAGSDGSIRVWNPKSGNEMYRMDGFDDVTSICLDKEILVTNGMNEYVCIHDFDVDDELGSSYDLEW